MPLDKGGAYLERTRQDVVVCILDDVLWPPLAWLRQV